MGKGRYQPLRAYQAADVCKAGWSRKPAGGHLMGDIPGTGDNEKNVILYQIL